MDEHELVLLDSWARARGWSKSQAVRVALRALTRSMETDPLMKGCGMIDGLPVDLSGSIDKYLGETYVAEKTASKYRQRRRSR